jgi:hypothetical protein
MTIPANVAMASRVDWARAGPNQLTAASAAIRTRSTIAMTSARL